MVEEVTSTVGTSGSLCITASGITSVTFSGNGEHYAWFDNLAVTFPPSGAVTFLRGDCNSDGNIDLSDAVFLLLFNFVGGSTPACLAACDMDGDGQVTGTVTDAVYLLTYKFGGGSPPAMPFPACGTIDGRPGDEALGCEMGHTGC